jgi:hypothetical protein
VFIISGIAKAATTTTAPIALDKAMVHGGMTGPFPHRPTASLAIAPTATAGTV